MHGDGAAAAGFEKDARGFFRVHVHRAQDAARLIGADRDHAEIDGSEAFTDLAEGLAVAAVSGVPQRAVGSFDQPSAPVALVSIPQAACGEMLGGRGGEFYFGSDLDIAKPWDFSDMREARTFQPCRMTFRDKERQVFSQLAEGGKVQMIVVRVGEQYRIDMREIIQGAGKCG